MEGSLAFNGVVKHKNSTAVATRRNTEDGGMTAFQAADAQTVAIQKLVDRIDQLAVFFQVVERTTHHLGQLSLNRQTNRPLQAIEFLIQFEQGRFGFYGRDWLRG